MALLPSYSFALLLLAASLSLSAQPLFDTHLHYSADDAKDFSPQEIIQRLDTNKITYAAVTGMPTEHVSMLYQLAPERIFPILSVYRKHSDKASWTTDQSVIPYLKSELAHGYWRGIGELHIFAENRHSDVFKAVIELASAWQLPLLIHGDPAVIDTVYEIAPEQVVIWAHAGTYPYPELVSDYLRRYPNLSIDVSMRDGRIAPNGEMADEWYELFVNYSDRIMVGVDTYTVSRWHNLEAATDTIRDWLMQLPDDIVQQIALTNAANLYRKSQQISAEE